MNFIKICGIRTIDDALIAAAAGATAIGLNFFQNSPRYIDTAQAQAIVSKLPSQVLAVGLFVNATADEVLAISKRVGLRYAQLHGNESPDDCRKLREFSLIKALHVESPEQIAEDIARFSSVASFSLLDAPSENFGGSGRTIDLSLLKDIPLNVIRQRCILAGGLNASNVAVKIKQLHPFGVDVSSGVESSPGVKDAQKVKGFVSAARAAFEAQQTQ